jgi:CHASE2 domain-containing sensor protein
VFAGSTGAGLVNLIAFLRFDMSKMWETAIDMLSQAAKIYFPPIYNLIKRGVDLKTLSMSRAAHYSRLFGARAILTVGVLATVYATYLFAINVWTPAMPKASHDAILKNRFSSPLPSRDILIVDIDERSLAALSDKHGRWPWSRDVLADGLQKFNDLGARAVLFNVLFSDPDKKNPDADAAMDVTAQMNRATAFPLIRLNPKNDAQSQLNVAQIPGVELRTQNPGNTTVAVILPMFGAMHDRLGVANQRPDVDGIVRQYPLRWEEDTFVLPSMVQRTAELGGADLAQVPNLISMNWRNKRGRYDRVSFSDVLLDQLQPGQVQAFKSAFVVLSLSAPGLGQTKPTSVASVEDDGEILATALDDALHQTYLRMMPNSLALLINLLTIWGLVWMTVRQKSSGFMNKAFVLVQSGLGGVTLLSASYTNYLIDLSDSMSFGLSVFAAIKLVQSMDDRWSRARPGFRKVRQNQDNGQLMLLGFLDHQLSATQVQALQTNAERVVGMTSVVRVDDLFGGESFIKSHCAKFKALLVYVLPSQTEAINALLAHAEFADVNVVTHEMTQSWNTENKDFAAEVAPLVLASAAQLLHEVGAVKS